VHLLGPGDAEYPETGKYGPFAGAAPGGQAAGAVQRFVRVEDVDYLEGE